ncbi:MAG: alpha/beta hydrolase [Saprospiraceae bacterium]|nr:alpha/beta hydrolase [Saprospiraceae bacterium]MCB9320290.1 alpha/beta hydrolase [Lewinellaceae bacterium]
MSGRSLFALIGFVLLSFAAQTQSVGKVDSGAIDGVGYRVVFPDNWQHKLVMYAHGYEAVGTPIRQSQNPYWIQSMSLFLDRGFAVAASDYANQGLALAQGVDDTEKLRHYFIDQYGKPDTTYIVGHSMGGGVTLSLIENFGDAYDGGLPLCPLSSPLYVQTRKEFDLYATFNGLFPGIVATLEQIFDLQSDSLDKASANMVQRAKIIQEQLNAEDTTTVNAFARKFNLKTGDLPFILFFDEKVLRDLAKRFGGNPFDNTNTLYSGFADDLKVNLTAERMMATTDPDALFAKYDRNGNLSKPVVIMHTMYDQLIPPTYGVVNYENMVHEQGKDAFLVVKYTNGQGHCNFTPAQTATAFDALRAWVHSGVRARPGYVD